MIELLQLQNKRLKSQLAATVKEAETGKSQIKVELEKEKEENVRLKKMYEELEVNQKQQQQQQKFVGFTPIDPKHRVVLEEKEREIVGLEEQLMGY